MPREYKLLFTGTMGAGKTTAIAAISEIPPVKTDVATAEAVTDDKTTTTAAMDYGEVGLEGGDVLRLYGTPGQGRFDFMWKILSEGALGAIILVDNRRPDPLADLEEYVTAFKALVSDDRAVVGIGRMGTHPEPGLSDYYERIAGLGLRVPVVPVDVRERSDVLLLLEILFSQIEAAEQRISAAG